MKARRAGKTMTSDTKPPFIGRIISRPELYLVGSFLALILLGAGLLRLPAAQARPINLLDCLFTSTSAVCVTGLIVVDTGHDFSRFGQTVILLLIQLGGLGIMTFAALVIHVAGRKLSFRSQTALQDVFFQRSAATKFRRDLLGIVMLTLLAEFIGAMVLYSWRPRDGGLGLSWFTAVFHAISAFCNAGFSTFSDSLIGFRSEPLVMITVSLLIITGGLGYATILEAIGRFTLFLRRREKPVVWTLNTRVVIATSGALIVLGALALAVLGMRSNAPGAELPRGGALFQSITARTAGFNTVDIGRLPLSSLLCLIFLMFVGGSPGSCAGGVKTTTLAIWVARLKARLRQADDVTMFRRRIPVDLVRRTGLLLGVAMLYNLVGVMVLSISEKSGTPLQDLLFEQISAFATVGLSTGITPALSTVGRLWIILSMFVGRLGPLTIALVVVEHKQPPARLAEERLMVG
jgi:trk system potassium uptake protein TrkH